MKSQRTVSAKKVISTELSKLNNEKHLLFNIWKEKRDRSAYNTYKIIRNANNPQLRKPSNAYAKKNFVRFPYLNSKRIYKHKTQTKATK